MRIIAFRCARLGGLFALLAALSGLGTFTQAESAERTADGKRVVEDKPKKARALAASMDFADSLGLDLESLKSFGSRIDQARAAKDPVSLVCAARELAAAEQVAGKQTSLKASDLTCAFTG
jgi:hypothetical protein